MKSIWSATISTKTYAKLKGDAKTEVLIIGGGLAGLLCAYFLKQKAIPYILVEAGRIGMGVTQNTTAKITAQHGLIYKKFMSKIGPEKTSMYLEANLKAIDKYKEIAQGVDCDFEEKPAYVYSMDQREKIEEEIAALEKINYKTEFCESLFLDFPICGAIRFDKQAQFHPLKFIKGISADLNIYEHTMVKKLEANIAYTDHAKITASKIIVATHFPFVNFPGFYFTKLYQQRSYVIALENAPDIQGMYIDEAKNGMSFRNYKDYLLVGGGGHRTGKQGGSYQELRSFIQNHYPDSKEAFAWATQDCMSLDNIPYIGPYSRSTPDLFVATGFNKWGITSSMVSALLLSDLIAGKENQFEEVFTTGRSIFKKQLFLNLGVTAVNFLTLRRTRCPHLGCSLKWNKQERTWDCTCHGSRFTKEGQLINNPAMKDAKIKKKIK